MMKTFSLGIDQVQTGLNIKNLRIAHGFSVRDIQEFMNFAAPQAIYKWERGACLPDLDHLAALADLYGILIDDILIRIGNKAKIRAIEQQDSSCCPNHFWDISKYTA